MKQQVDSNLIALIRSGDELAFAEFFCGLKEPLFRFLFSLTKSQQEAEDILQEVFISIWQKKDALEDIANLNGFVFTIAKNKALDYLRKKTNFVEISDSDLIHSHQADPFSILKGKELQEQVCLAISGLPQKQKMAYQMFKEEDMPQKEIAQKLNVSISTVKNQVMQAISNIKKNIFF
ncbi:MAG: hypothetical protein DI598_05650 [Pseudopedobacter saltans]|uniref:RNA polymerase, sigma-24 subunit, ECF subfamily n=1 Tax=Pseudopedobacter saltans TaxID=151895 RepID=A0A2W5F4S4_9SPHI|nr:MAG: hypothetical protein DI598_05650 [Pseudopedobacter saltans]